MYYTGIKRDVPFPGNQINDINQFREMCYRQCHLDNPTDSGWYEKVNQCGQDCKYALKAYEYMQGKNPCRLKLQAPVFWFNNTIEKEGFEPEPSEPKEPTNLSPDVTKLTMIMYMILIGLVILMIIVLMIVIFMNRKSLNKYPGRR